MDRLPNIGHGFWRAFETIITGILIVALVRGLLGAYNLEFLVILFDIISIIALVLLYERMKYWGVGYSIGWIIGLLLFISILSPLEAVLYVIVFIIAFGVKIRNKIRRFFQHNT